MNNLDYYNKIRDCLTSLVSDVKSDNKNNLQIINIFAEGFFCEFLNQLFQWNLTNANSTRKNAKGIDLICKGSKIIVQVSSTTTKDKVQKSLDKSKAYDGYRFYFVAISDDVNDIKDKKYIKYGLDFNPKQDIFSKTDLCSKVFSLANSGRIDSIIELYKTVQKYFEPIDIRKKLSLPKLQTKGEITLLSFDADCVPLLGRDEELHKLKDFVFGKTKEPFLWYAIAAAGGSGKTRIAYELQKIACNENWSVVCLTDRVYDYRNKFLVDISDWYPESTLIIVDYAQRFASDLKKRIDELLDVTITRKHPLRLLLLDRNVENQNGCISWINQIEQYKENEKYLYDGKPLLLAQLKANDLDAPENDPLICLINAFSLALRKKDPSLPELSENDAKQLRNRLGVIDRGLNRPLIAMLLTYSWLHNSKADKWSRTQIIHNIVEREWRIIKTLFEAFLPTDNNNLLDSFRLLWQTATFLGIGGNSPIEADELFDLLPNHRDTISRITSEGENSLSFISPYHSPNEMFFLKFGLIKDEEEESGKVTFSSKKHLLTPMHPDLFGEYFVFWCLKSLKKYKDRQRTYDFFSAIVERPTISIGFFRKFLFDYKKVMINEENQRLVLPYSEDLNFDIKRSKKYIELIEGLLNVSEIKEAHPWIESRMSNVKQASTICSEIEITSIINR